MDYQVIITTILASGGFWAVISALVAAWLDKRRAKREQNNLSVELMDAHTKALRGLLYGELERRCTYYIKKGSIKAAALKDLREYYYEPYSKGLGGNGTIKKLFERVEQLPVE